MMGSTSPQRAGANQYSVNSLKEAGHRLAPARWGERRAQEKMLWNAILKIVVSLGCLKLHFGSVRNNRNRWQTGIPSGASDATKELYVVIISMLTS